MRRVLHYRVSRQYPCTSKVSKVLDERAARHATGRVASYIERPSDNALGNSNLGESIGELLGKRQSSGRVAGRVTAGKGTRQVTGLVAGSFSHYASPPNIKTSPSQPGTGRKTERREFPRCANVGIRGSGMEFLLYYQMLVLTDSRQIPSIKSVYSRDPLECLSIYL
jgi:hypothetical protein